MNELELAERIANDAASLVDMLRGEEPSLVAYSQRDRRWAGKLIPGSYLTIGAAGCYITCVAMLATLTGSEDTPDVTARKLADAGALVNGSLVVPQKIEQAYPRLAWRGRRDWLNTEADLDFIREHLPLILQVEFAPGGARPPRDQHFVLALGFDGDGDDVRIADPWSGGVVSLLTNYARPEWTLSRAVYGARWLEVT